MRPAISFAPSRKPKVVKLTFIKGASLNDPARSTSTKEKKLTNLPSRRSSAKRSPSTVASRSLPGKRSPESKRPTTIADYIRAAPSDGQLHLRRLYAILKSVAPEAEETIKWGTPFFVEPRFLFAFSAHKAHLDLAPTAAGLEPFRKELEKYKTTKELLQLPYDKPLPEGLVRKIAEHRLREVRERADDGFW